MSLALSVSELCWLTGRGRRGPIFLYSLKEIWEVPNEVTWLCHGLWMTNTMMMAFRKPDQVKVTAAWIWYPVATFLIWGVGFQAIFSLPFLALLTPSIPDGLAIDFDFDVINLLIFVCSYWSPGSVPLSSALYYFLPSNSLEFNFFFSPQLLKVKLKLPILTLFWTHTPKSTQELCQCCVSWGPQTYTRPIFIIYSTEMFPHFPFTSLTHRLFQKCDARTFYQNLGTI